MSDVLFVVSGADHWTLADGTRHPSGFWAEELVAPYRAVTAAGHRVTVATPDGVRPTVDRMSLRADMNGGDDAARRVEEQLGAIAELEHPVRLSDVDVEAYGAVFYPGGHGPMEDLAVDANSAKVLIRALESGTPLALVCHGPAAMLAAVREDGTNAFAGYRVSAFANTEETQVGFADKARWLLQDRLVEAGVDYQEGDPWVPKVVVDRHLITGQNPASAAPLAIELLHALA
jgi:putative intracellular protease/amidase